MKDWVLILCYGNKLPYGGDKNMLSHDFVYVDNPRAFMKNQGYEMAERVNIKETEFVSGGAMGGEENITYTVTDLKQLGDSKITYTTSNHLNEKTNKRTVLNDQGKWNSIETTTYTLTKPYGQSNEQTAKYGSKGTIEKSVGALGVVVDWITRYFENKK